MKIRNKILLYFSTTVISLTVISSVIIYLLFSEYREEEFQQRQKEKIKYTIGLIADYKELSENLTAIMDKHTIHDFYDEKMLIFSKEKNLIYKSVDDLPIHNYGQLLNGLSPASQCIETKDGKYDIVAVYIENDYSHYYAISKAYDAFGYSKLKFLKNVLIIITSIISMSVLLITLFLSKRISDPITTFANKLTHYDIDGNTIAELDTETSSFELNDLTEKFNHLIKRTNEAFAFQKHTVHHISHQLKTPVAVLVSELERIRNLTVPEMMRQEIETQIVKTKSLGGIINVLLEISKIESGVHNQKEHFRIDELIFDVIAELNIIYPSFHFEVNYVPDEVDENKLVVNLNPILIRQAFQNLLFNAISYNDGSKAEIILNGSCPDKLTVQIVNSGSQLTKEEEKLMFNHFFRGNNSVNKTGFGLGLVLTKKILELNGASISYTKPSAHLNVFEISFLS